MSNLNSQSKNLNNLVDNIYSSLTPLSKGDAINISDAEIDRTVEDIREALLQWARPSKRNKSFTLRMSNVGKPARQLWFENKNPTENNITPSNQIRFLYGHLLEAVALMLTRLAGYNVSDEQKEVNVKGVSGHIDCKINGEVVDVKTASRISFDKFQKGTLSEDDPFGYLGQLSGYEEAEGTSNGGFLVISKDSGELCFHQPDSLDKININSRIKYLKSSMKLDTPPELCYDPIPEGAKGNMKLPRQCSYCSFKFKCHDNSNDGSGLRTFKYSKGPVYLTKVVVTPKVEEV
tara:strand:- start:3406 stop:4278 length:873 start_codon:yes stop_codon:yes gene_type:complete